MGPRFGSPLGPAPGPLVGVLPVFGGRSGVRRGSIWGPFWWPKASQKVVPFGYGNSPNSREMPPPKAGFFPPGRLPPAPGVRRPGARSSWARLPPAPGVEILLLWQYLLVFTRVQVPGRG